jgi:hypothetical protein
LTVLGVLLVVMLAVSPVAITGETEHVASSAAGELVSISCSSARACTAIGSTESTLVAERWNGTKWAVEAPPTPKGGLIVNFGGVSCATRSECVAVGQFELLNKQGVPRFYALAERWDGTKWTIQPTPLVLSNDYFFGVSCTAARQCTAVGFDLDSSHSENPLIERWNGVKWVAQPTPAVAGGGSLFSVSCSSARACTAVGEVDSNVGGTLAERWNGTKWSIQSMPVLAGAILSSVSCASTSFCVAVGHDMTGTLAEGWNGTKWSIQSTPSPKGRTVLLGVACVSARACTAVGQSDLSLPDDRGFTLAERWNGTKWSIQSTPDPRGGGFTELDSVSCLSTSACTAVGSYAEEQSTLAEHWAGKTWAIQSTG